MAIDEKKLIEEIENIQVAIVGMRTGKSEFSEHIKRFKNHIIQIINNQPKYRLKNKTSDNMNSSCSGQVWIPVSERLPEANQMVLATEKDSVILCCYEFVDGYGYCFYGSHGEVIAWMPLPKPFKVLRGNCEVEG